MRNKVRISSEQTKRRTDVCLKSVMAESLHTKVNVCFYDRDWRIVLKPFLFPPAAFKTEV